MLKKRLVFTLLVQDGKFMLSRNFSLQTVGDLGWLREYYEFDSIAFSIDELVILDVSRGRRDRQRFSHVIEELAETCFMPLTAGGGISRVDDARLLLTSGADKITVNTALFGDPALVRRLVELFGSQCVVASIDYRRTEDSSRVFTENGTRDTGLTVSDAVALAESLAVGEIYLTSMSKDGTGQGFDLEYVCAIAERLTVPVIISGGAGNASHLSEGLRAPSIAAVSTAHLFNFMADNLTDAREQISAEGTPLAVWARLPRTR